MQFGVDLVNFISIHLYSNDILVALIESWTLTLEA